MLFIDESRFCLDFTDRCQLVWRMPKLNLMNRTWQNMTVMARAQSWFGQALASMEKTDLYVIENRH